MSGSKSLATLTAFGLIFGSVSIASATTGYASTFHKDSETTLSVGAIMSAAHSAAPKAESKTGPAGSELFSFGPGKSAFAPGHTGTAGQAPASGVFDGDLPPGLNHSNGKPNWDKADGASSGEGDNTYATPIPPTIWLLATALLGLLGFGARRSRAA